MVRDQSAESLKQWTHRLRKEQVTADDLECLSDVLENATFEEIEKFVHDAGVSLLIQTCKDKSTLRLFQYLNFLTFRHEFQTVSISAEGHSFYMSLSRFART
eukprot:UN02028